MIKVTYEDDETGQTATFTIKAANDFSAKVGIVFDPSAKDDLKDPFGILGKLVLFFSGKSE
jgi:hypothetical protein